jgi:hypothetical protein
MTTTPTSFTQHYLFWGAQSLGLDPSNSRQGYSKYLTYAGHLKAASETELEEKTFPEECPWSLKEIFPSLENKDC